MARDNSRLVAEALNAVIRVLTPLDQEARARVLDSVSTFFGHGRPTAHVSTAAPAAGLNHSQALRPAFSESKAPSPKEFLFQKQPKTDVERITCLAFYLTHFREMLHFKTLDLGKPNTEAAQIKFSNTAYATDNATKAGYLAAAMRGQKQITAWGEQFVAALPDREAAAQVLAQLRKRRKKRPKS
jgi:restriction endonuclease Mrr